MADLSITAASVVKGSGASVSSGGTAGAGVTAGQAVYEDGTDSNKLKLADANASQTTARVKGIALHGTLTGQPLAVLTAGLITIGATLTVGMVYVLSATPGAICPVSDLATNMYTTIIGVAISTTVLQVDIKISDVATP